MNRYKILNSKTLMLSPIQVSDRKRYIDLFQCKKTMKFIVPLISISEASRNFDYIIKDNNEIYYSIYLRQSVLTQSSLTQSNKFLGFIGVSREKENHKNGELGVLLKSKVAPKGTSKDAVNLLLPYLFNENSFERIKIRVSADNKPALISCKALNADFSCTQKNDNPQVGYFHK